MVAAEGFTDEAFEPVAFDGAFGSLAADDEPKPWAFVVVGLPGDTERATMQPTPGEYTLEPSRTAQARGPRVTSVLPGRGQIRQTVRR